MPSCVASASSTPLILLLTQFQSAANSIKLEVHISPSLLSLRTGGPCLLPHHWLHHNTRSVTLRSGIPDAIRIFHSCLEISDGAALSLPTSLRDWRHVTSLSLCLLCPEPEPGSARPAIGRPSPLLASDWSIPGLWAHCQGQAGPAESVLARARGVIIIEQLDLSVDNLNTNSSENLEKSWTVEARMFKMNFFYTPGSLTWPLYLRSNDLDKFVGKHLLKCTAIVSVTKTKRVCHGVQITADPPDKRIILWSRRILSPCNKTDAVRRPDPGHNNKQ